MKLALFSENMIVHVEDPKELTKIKQNQKYLLEISAYKQSFRT